jgi:hypothetical protein
MSTPNFRTCPITFLLPVQPSLVASIDPISGSFTTFCVDLELGLLSSPGITRLRRSYEPVRHPRRPGLDPRGSPVGCSPTHRWGLPVSHHPLCPHVPPSIPRRSVRVPLSLASPDVPAFPQSRLGRPPHCPFRGLLNVHYPLRPVCSPSHPRWPSTPKALIASLPPRSLRLLPAGATVAGWVYSPLRERTFSRRTRING